MRCKYLKTEWYNKVEKYNDNYGNKNGNQDLHSFLLSCSMITFSGKILAEKALFQYFSVNRNVCTLSHKISKFKFNSLFFCTMR